MPNVAVITDEFIRSLAPNAAAVSNGMKISRSGGFISLYKTADETLIFGDCKGSGKNPYHTSADFSGESPVFRCSCPSRQFPCKHSLAIMYEWLAGKEFTAAEVPEDILKKREKIAKKSENSEKAASEKKAPKQNKAAALKKLKKQAEGLELAERFVNDVLSRGISSVNSASAEQYKNLAKQLGDYYLPEPQSVMYEIVNAAEGLSGTAGDREAERIVSLCVKLSSTVKKCKEYISAKTESGEVLPEDSILYEAMGNVWKLSQLKETGLFRENEKLIQLSFSVLHDRIHKADIDTAYWCCLTNGDIMRTENIRPLKAAKYIKEEDSVFGVHSIKELYIYPGGLNRRVRWENAEISEASDDVYAKIMSKSETSISEAAKKAKNELKNTLSRSAAAILIKYDSIGFAADGHAVLKLGEETISLRANENYPDTCDVLAAADADILENGVMLGEFFYIPEERRICICPVSLINESGITRLC